MTSFTARSRINNNDNGKNENAYDSDIVGGRTNAFFTVALLCLSMVSPYGVASLMIALAMQPAVDGIVFAILWLLASVSGALILSALFEDAVMQIIANTKSRIHDSDSGQDNSDNSDTDDGSDDPERHLHDTDENQTGNAEQ